MKSHAITTNFITFYFQRFEFEFLFLEIISFTFDIYIDFGLPAVTTLYVSVYDWLWLQGFLWNYSPPLPSSLISLASFDIFFHDLLDIFFAHHNKVPAMVSNETKVLSSFFAQYPDHILTVFLISLILNWWGSTSAASGERKSHKAGNCLVLIML